jgi:6-phosphogluconolactonase (cycloisomerase 2 family)
MRRHFHYRRFRPAQPARPAALAYLLLSQHGARNSDYLYVQDRHYGGRAQIDYVNLLRVNTVTGRLAAERIDSPEHVMRWLLDFDGEPRLVQTLDKDISAIHYRDPATKTWRKLAEFNAYSGSKGLYAARLRPDGTLYVIANRGLDTTGVYTFDVNKLQLSKRPWYGWMAMTSAAIC